MYAALLRIELRIPDVRSLKAKRRVVRPIVEGLRRVASLSVAEVDHHDVWQRSTVGVALVAPDARHLERLIDEIRRYLDLCYEAEVIEMGVSFLEDPE